MLWGENRERWKGRELPGVEPRTSTAWATSVLPLSYDNRTTMHQPSQSSIWMLWAWEHLLTYVHTSAFWVLPWPMSIGLTYSCLAPHKQVATVAPVASPRTKVIARCGDHTVGWALQVDTVNIWKKNTITLWPKYYVLKFETHLIIFFAIQCLYRVVIF